MKWPASIILAIVSGTLFALCWNNFLPAISIFCSFVPLFIILEDRQLPQIKFFNLSFFTFIIYHLGTVWWLAKSSVFGFLVIIISNSMYLAFAMLLIYKIRKIFGLFTGLFSFVCIWLAFEYIHFWWELSWPFMNLGNWLGQIHKFIQWYEYTGVLGGTLWILLINLFVYLTIREIQKKNIQKSVINIVISILFIVVPILISFNIYDSYTDDKEFKIFTIIQPNIDPYTEKYNSGLFEQQVNNQINQAFQSDSSVVDCYLFPESSFPAYLNEDSCSTHPVIRKIADKLMIDDRVIIVGGMYSFRIVNRDSLFYNTAFGMVTDRKPETRHKSKLVIGVEKMPFQDYFGFLKKWNLNLGGFTNSLTIDSESKNFFSKDSSFSIAPIVCYESVYGDYISDFAKKGATCIAVITNDGWWGDSPGYRQHFMHSILRAIENRRNVVRSANTGVSCIINGRGDIMAQLNPFSKKTLTGKVYQNKAISFYAKNGDYIGKLAFFCSIVLLIMALIKIILRRHGLLMR